ncbi:MAG: cytochrome P450 [Gammaproteobacteria bacterium]
MNPEVASVPAHVPPELVFDVDFAAMPGVMQDPHGALARLLDYPPVFYAPRARFGGPAWVLARHALIEEAYQDAGLFSSRHNADFSSLIGEDWRLIPLEIDPPLLAQYRALLTPLLSPARMAALETGVRETCIGLIESFRGRGGCEFMRDFGLPFPVTIFLRLMGLPLDEARQFNAWEEDIIHGTTLQARADAARAIKDYLMRLIAERRRRPADDITSHVVHGRIGERAVTDEEALGVCYLLFVAGLDTVGGVQGYQFWHLARDPALQARLAGNAEAIAAFVEESLRAYAIVFSGRELTRDAVFHGAPMKAGDKVVLPTPLAGRDPAAYAHPDRFDMDRPALRHMAFGLGPHRCLGSHLARRELRVAIDEWLRRIPRFRIDPGDTVVPNPVSTWGMSRLPLSWPA